MDKVVPGGSSMAFVNRFTTSMECRDISIFTSVPRYLKPTRSMDRG